MHNAASHIKVIHDLKEKVKQLEQELHWHVIAEDILVASKMLDQDTLDKVYDIAKKHGIGASK